MDVRRQRRSPASVAETGLVVDLAQHLSHPSQQLLRMLNGGSTPFTQASDATTIQKPRQKHVRLSTQRQTELIAKYQAGALQRELAEEYGINRRTVSEIVARHGCLSRGKLTSAQIDEAVTAYLDGQSLATIAKRLEVSDHTVRSRLLERGVVMRKPGGVTTPQSF